MSRGAVRVPGFRFSGVACGIKPSGRDLALIVSDAPAAAAGVLTRSTVVGAPVVLCRQRLRNGRARVIVVNSGCSNVAMGARGHRDAREMGRLAAGAIGVSESDVLVASTGVIGDPLPMVRVRRGIRAASAALAGRGLADAARAILTTDTREKIASRRIRVAGRDVVVAGVAKGSGMIEPNMATMLAFLVTDAAATPSFLRPVCCEAPHDARPSTGVSGRRRGRRPATPLLLLAGGERRRNGDPDSAIGHAAPERGVFADGRARRSSTSNWPRTWLGTGRGPPGSCTVVRGAARAAMAEAERACPAHRQLRC